MSNNKQPKSENPNNQFSNTEPLTHAQKVAIANKMSNNKQGSKKDLAYWKNNAEENYITTPISVLKYIHKLEEHIETIKAQLLSDEELSEEAQKQWGNVHSVGVVGWLDGAKWMRDKIQGGDK